MFLQKYQKFQKLCCPVLATWSQVNLVAFLQSRAYTKGFCDSLAGQSPSHEKDLEIFQNSGFLNVSRLGLATCSPVEAPVVRLYRNFRGSLHNLLAGGPFSREKHLDKFFKILSLRCLVTCLQLGSITKNVCFAL